jgi:hypothetical protein
MVFFAQVLPFSIGNIVPIIISILFGTLTAWLSAQIITSRPSLQGALLFSAISYLVLIVATFIPSISIPFINMFILIEVLIKSLLAMKFFNSDFKGGVAITAVQMLLDIVIILPF